MRVYFRLKAKSDLVFIASSNTEGNIKYLDFVPGSAIFGAVANQAFEPSLLSGEIRFSDAHTIIEGEFSYKIPFSFHYEKLEDSNTVFNAFRLNEKDYENNQYKQIRRGYINENLTKKTVELNYAQKSERNYEKGRSKKSQMFGFKSIPKGSEFIFSVYFENEADDKIIEMVENVKYLGKSKRNEYGWVEIKKINYKEKMRTFDSDEIYLYFKSRVCLIDENGNFTYDLTKIHPKLKKENILFDKNYVRYYRYSPYNFVRKGYDSERLVIDKGSVIALKNVDDEILEEIKKGVGAFLNEGFGEVLVNPFFFKNKQLKLKEIEETNKKEAVRIQSDLANYLKNKKEKTIRKMNIVSEVYNLVEDELFTRWFGNITSSQWGNIRTLAMKEDFVEKIRDYISHGIKKWREDQIDKLMKTIENKDREFVILLANQMGKKAKK